MKKKRGLWPYGGPVFNVSEIKSRIDPVRKDPFYFGKILGLFFKKYFSKNNWNNSDFYSGYFHGNLPGNLPEEFFYNFNEINSCQRSWESRGLMK